MKVKIRFLENEKVKVKMGDEYGTTSCGLSTWRPKWLQIFASRQVFTILSKSLQLKYMMVYRRNLSFFKPSGFVRQSSLSPFADTDSAQIPTQAFTDDVLQRVAHITSPLLLNYLRLRVQSPRTRLAAGGWRPSQTRTVRDPGREGTFHRWMLSTTISLSVLTPR